MTVTSDHRPNQREWFSLLTIIQIQIQFYLHKVRKVYNEGPRRVVLPFAISKSSTQRETLLSVPKINGVTWRGVLLLTASKSYHSTQREGFSPSLCVENQWSDAMRGSTPCHIEILPFNTERRGKLSPHIEIQQFDATRVENQHDKGGIPLLHQNRKDSTWEGYPPIALKHLGVFVSR